MDWVLDNIELLLTLCVMLFCLCYFFKGASTSKKKCIHIYNFNIGWMNEWKRKVYAGDRGLLVNSMLGN